MRNLFASPNGPPSLPRNLTGLGGGLGTATRKTTNGNRRAGTDSLWRNLRKEVALCGT
jgi:hypothetical protein